MVTGSHDGVGGRRRTVYPPCPDSERSPAVGRNRKAIISHNKRHKATGDGQMDQKKEQK